MSGDSTNLRQEFTTELESILESDEAYGSNVQVLTYSLKEDVISGKFKDSWNNRVYEFIVDTNGISYKPAIKLDSFSADEMPARFDSYSEGYASLFVDTRFDGKLTGKRTKKPKCGNSAYGCGYSCIGLLKTCRILSSENKGGAANRGRAIGKERLTKLIAKAAELAKIGDKKGASTTGAIATEIQKTRTKYTGGGQALISERAWTKLEQEKAESLAKEREKKPAKPQGKKPVKPKPEPAKSTSDPTTNPKTHSIKTQKEFEDVLYHVVDKLSKANDEDLYIATIRESIGELVSRDKFNEYLKNLQAEDNIILYSGSGNGSRQQVENSISTPLGGMRFRIQLEDKGQKKLEELSKDKKKQSAINEQLDKRPELDHLGSARKYEKGGKITSQKDFNETVGQIVKTLDDEFNSDEVVPINKVREILSKRIPKDVFDKMLLEAGSGGGYQLSPGTGTDTGSTDKPIYNAMGTPLRYVQKLKQ